MLVEAAQAIIMPQAAVVVMAELVAQTQQPIMEALEVLALK
jgi:hypothetical protein